MVQDPTLFTAVEWVLAGLAFAVSLLLFLVVHKAGPGSPFAVRPWHTTYASRNSLSHGPTFEKMFGNV